MSVRTILVSAAHRAALCSGYSLRRARRQPVRRIFMLHGVCDADFPAQVLERNLTWLGRHFRIVSLDEIVCGLASGAPPDGEVALTFDDGLRNHFRVAYPVLRRLRAAATFFVCPGLIDHGQWLWNHESRARLKALTPERRTGLARSMGCARADADGVVEWMKSLGPDERSRAEAEIRGATPAFAPSDGDRLRFDPMTWEELRELDPALITIGSHTMTHPILSTVDDACLQHELAQSRARLESELGRAVEFFCFPNGANDARVRAAAARVYRAAVTTRPGSLEGRVDLHGLPRLSMPESDATLAWRMWR